jgi:hypothetical protein
VKWDTGNPVTGDKNCVRHKRRRVSPPATQAEELTMAVPTVMTFNDIEAHIELSVPLILSNKRIGMGVDF